MPPIQPLHKWSNRQTPTNSKSLSLDVCGWHQHIRIEPTSLRWGNLNMWTLGSPEQNVIEQKQIKSHVHRRFNEVQWLGEKMLEKI